MKDRHFVQIADAQWQERWDALQAHRKAQAEAEAQDAVTHAGTDAPEFATGGGVIAAVVIGAVLSVALAVFLLGGM